VLLKDNIESADGLATTAGSLALKDNVTGRDAPIVKRLTDAGAVIVGKTNLSEWANFRSSRSISGWSGMAGLVRNPYSLDRSACGSSAGSAVAIAAGLATLSLGTETDGSIICPAAINGVVGLKPTVGLVSRTFIVPISPQQDTPGPMTRYVADAAAMLTVIAGSDPADPMTAEADAHRPTMCPPSTPGRCRRAPGGPAGEPGPLGPDRPGLRDGARRPEEGRRRAGRGEGSRRRGHEQDLRRRGEALRVEFKAALNGYLSALPPVVKSRTLENLIAFDLDEPREMPLFRPGDLRGRDQGAADHRRRLPRQARDRDQAGARGLDKLLADNNLAALIGPSTGPASIVDPVNSPRGTGSYSTLPAVSGYPHLTVPMGFVTGLPVGLSFLGPAWSEARLLSLGYAFEQATTRARTRLSCPTSTRGRKSPGPSTRRTETVAPTPCRPRLRPNLRRKLQYRFEDVDRWPGSGTNRPSAPVGRRRPSVI